MLLFKRRPGYLLHDARRSSRSGVVDDADEVRRREALQSCSGSRDQIGVIERFVEVAFESRVLR